MASLVEFPFAAIGLLTDNAMALEADSIMVGIGGEKGSHWIKIEDNGKIIWSEKELIRNMASFCSQNNPVLTGCEKRVKKVILRDNGLREYGVNLKLGCLRLGKRFLLLISREASKTVISCSK